MKMKMKIKMDMELKNELIVGDDIEKSSEVEDAQISKSCKAEEY